MSSACSNVTALVRAAECDVVRNSLNFPPLDNFMDTTFLCSGPSTSLQATSHLNGSTPTAVSPVLTLTSSKYSIFLSQPPQLLCFLYSPARSMLVVTHLPFQHSSLCQSRNTYVPVLILVEVSTYRLQTLRFARLPKVPGMERRTDIIDTPCIN